MKMKLTKYNNDWYFVLPPEIIEILKINPKSDFVDLNIENKTLKIKKMKK